MKLIHDSTGGRVPRYWRPPYGDADMRVRAIASEVFGLQTVVWNNEYVISLIYFCFSKLSFLAPLTGKQPLMLFRPTCKNS